MRKFVVISTELDKVNNPFVFAVRKSMGEIEDGTIYLYHSIDLVAEFPNFSYMRNRISDNIYWFSDVKDLDIVINSILSEYVRNVEIVLDADEMEFSGDFYHVQHGKVLYVLFEDRVYYVDVNIMSKLYQKNIGIEYFVNDCDFKINNMKVMMKEYGFHDETHSIDNFISYLERTDTVYIILFLFRHICNTRIEEPIYKLGTKYNNPYRNILLVEDYLNKSVIYNIDIDKCEAYDMRYGKLPARYIYNGFYSATGRIFSSSDEWMPPIQNLAKEKRDVLYAEKGCYLVEFDYKSFEFDILCQIVGLPIHDDPHTETYNILVGLPHHDPRPIGKKINYSFLYGQNEQRLADSIISDFDVVPAGFKDDFISKLHEYEVFKKIKPFEDKLKESVKDGVISNYFGRKLVVRKEHAILNYYIQSTASDILYNKFLHMLDMLDGKKNRIILQSHDSILIQLSEQSINTTNILVDLLHLIRSEVGGLYGRVEYDYGLDWKNMS